ncbi:sugar transferase [Actinosynnema sp. NPDC020468]|uniref:sugar transferase n=1 Tax=Actinosynnema sp. NPDC020468 TaxID=3154488 RepID=UPI0033C4C47E
MSGWLGFLGTVALALVVNEFGELSPWLARKVVRWAAGIRYPDRVEELEAVLEDRPGKLFKLVTALGFGCAALAHRITHPRGTGERTFRGVVIASDVLGAIAVVVTAALVLPDRWLPAGQLLLLAVGTVTAAALLGALALAGAWNSMVLGQGEEEFLRLGRGLTGFAVVAAVAAMATGLPDARVWVFAVAPAFALVALPVRYLLRRALWVVRDRDRCLRSVLVAGGAGEARDLVGRTRRAPRLGWRVDAVCTADGWAGSSDVPVVGRLDQVVALVRRDGYGVVALTPDPYWTPHRVRLLVAELEEVDAELVVDPALEHCVRSRLCVAGVLGLPLLWVAGPAFTGARRVVKTSVDKLVAAVALAVLAPVPALVALAITLDDGGPVVVRERRIGKGGKEFSAWTFRTATDAGVTRVGRVLRACGLAESPLLVTVLGGSMSLVGPRSLAPGEGGRLSAKPGLTGLCRISGRPDLTREQIARLDVRYLEDWSLALDVVILWRAVRIAAGVRYP